MNIVDQFLSTHIIQWYQKIIYQLNYFYEILTLSIISFCIQLNVSITSNESLFTNMDHIYTINTKQESITLDNRYYRLVDIILIFNQIENTQFELLLSFIDSL